MNGPEGDLVLGMNSSAGFLLEKRENIVFRPTGVKVEEVGNQLIEVDRIRHLDTGGLLHWTVESVWKRLGDKHFW